MAAASFNSDILIMGGTVPNDRHVVDHVLVHRSKLLQWLLCLVVSYLHTSLIVNLSLVLGFSSPVCRTTVAFGHHLCQ